MMMQFITLKTYNECRNGEKNKRQAETIAQHKHTIHSDCVQLPWIVTLVYCRKNYRHILFQCLKAR